MSEFLASLFIRLFNIYSEGIAIYVYVLLHSKRCITKIE